MQYIFCNQPRVSDMQKLCIYYNSVVLKILTIYIKFESINFNDSKLYRNGKIKNF